MDSTKAIDAAKRGNFAVVRACVAKGREYDPNKQDGVSNRQGVVDDAVPDVLS